MMQQTDDAMNSPAFISLGLEVKADDGQRSCVKDQGEKQAKAGKHARSVGLLRMRLSRYLYCWC
jgi:hypothetical protein